MSAHDELVTAVHNVFLGNPCYAAESRFRSAVKRPYGRAG